MSLPTKQSCGDIAITLKFILKTKLRCGPHPKTVGGTSIWRRQCSYQILTKVPLTQIRGLEFDPRLKHLELRLAGRSPATCDRNGPVDRPGAVPLPAGILTVVDVRCLAHEIGTCVRHQVQGTSQLRRAARHAGQLLVNPRGSSQLGQRPGGGACGRPLKFPQSGSASTGVLEGSGID